ncbi:MAG: alpha/beta hydrolase [Planctomycetota bacterium]|jgi:pimeloyl-ACP methyl ester carboxylesterase
MSFIRKAALQVGGALCMAALLGGALTGCPETRRFIFPAPRPQVVVPPTGSSLLEVDRPDGGKFWALYRAARAGQPTLVYLHGNGSQLANATSLLERFTANGLGFYAVEYPGYGPAAGEKPSEAAIYKAVDAALVHLRDGLGVPNESTVLVGRSLGTGVAGEMAARGYGARVVLISPFTSMPDMAALKASSSARSLVSDRFDTRQKADRITQPTLIVHGDADTLVPFSMGQELSRALPAARLHVLKGVGHNRIFSMGGDSLFGEIEGFARAAKGRSKEAVLR